MTIIIFALLLLNLSFVQAQELKPLYQLPEKPNLAVNDLGDTELPLSTFLVGSDKGLFRVTNRNNSIPLWTDGRVDQILLLQLPDSEGNIKPSWMLRTSKGIFVTQDLKNFEERDSGLPFLTIKKYKNNTTYLEKQIQEIKDISANPMNNQEIVTATKDNVYYSKDGGISWNNLGSMSKSTPGVKAVAVVTFEGQSVIFMSHPIFGLSYIIPDSKNAQWNDVAAGFEKIDTLSSPDEISDILPVIRYDSQGNKYTQLYISQAYIPRIYKFNWEEKKGELIYKGKEPTEAIDGLTLIDNVLLYTKLEGFGSIDIDTLTSPGIPAMEKNWDLAFACVPGMINTAWIPQTRSGFASGILLNELWLLYPGTINTPYAEIANGRKAIYGSAYTCRTAQGIEKTKKIIKDRNMNALVIDMKDDYGLLRYDSKDPFILEKAYISEYAVNLDNLIQEFKKDDIYLIARIVTFKDKHLSTYKQGKYAVWDSKNNKPWLGIKGYSDVVDEAGNVTGKETLYYDEYWVDPYSEEVWEYNVAIAKELIARGFDEIQFDYIRFPTDGTNLYNAKYRWQDKGMDKESALISFLSYARENIQAPIGIDIYGANGWYRSGTRTGQDAEMLAEYVDVIGPMFYPSHFEQTFLNFNPQADRTYRIYYYGSFRNTVLCRNRAIVRPWVQSFYLNCSYDRIYYDEDYIRKEFFGTRDAINRGYMCWNNVGNYEVTPPDISDSDIFIGTAPEASQEFRKPAIGIRKKTEYIDSDVSVLDSILQQYDNTSSYLPFLQIIPGMINGSN